VSDKSIREDIFNDLHEILWVRCQMSEMKTFATQPDEPVTDAAKFLTKRGQLVMKQFHLIGRRKCDHNAMLTVSTLILAIVQGTKGDQIYGLKFECEKSSDYREFVLMDFDELKELLLPGATRSATGIFESFGNELKNTSELR
jgi:hypothetical protein